MKGVNEDAQNLNEAGGAGRQGYLLPGQRAGYVVYTDAEAAADEYLKVLAVDSFSVSGYANTKILKTDGTTGFRPTLFRRQRALRRSLLLRALSTLTASTPRASYKLVPDRPGRAEHHRQHHQLGARPRSRAVFWPILRPCS